MHWNRRNESCGSRPFGWPSTCDQTSVGTGTGVADLADGSSLFGSRQTSRRSPSFSITTYSLPARGRGGPRKKQSARSVSVVSLTAGLGCSSLGGFGCPVAGSMATGTPGNPGPPANPPGGPPWVRSPTFHISLPVSRLTALSRLNAAASLNTPKLTGIPLNMACCHWDECGGTARSSTKYTFVPSWLSDPMSGFSIRIECGPLAVYWARNWSNAARDPRSLAICNSPVVCSTSVFQINSPGLIGGSIDLSSREAMQ